MYPIYGFFLSSLRSFFLSFSSREQPRRRRYCPMESLRLVFSFRTLLLLLPLLTRIRRRRSMHLSHACQAQSALCENALFHHHHHKFYRAHTHTFVHSLTHSLARSLTHALRSLLSFSTRTQQGSSDELLQLWQCVGGSSSSRTQRRVRPKEALLPTTAAAAAAAAEAMSPQHRAELEGGRRLLPPTLLCSRLECGVCVCECLCVRAFLSLSHSFILCCVASATSAAFAAFV